MSEARKLGLEHYRSLPYKRRVERIVDEVEGTYYVCSYAELPGLLADGETRAEAIKNGDEAFDDYIEARLHFGDLIPEPAGADRVARAMAVSERIAATASEGIQLGELVVEIKKAFLRRTMKAAIRGQATATTRAETLTRLQDSRLVNAG